MKISNDLKSGILVAIAITFFLIVLFKVGAFNVSSKGYDIHAKFSFANGIEKNAPVRLSGVAVGRVTRIELKENNGATAHLTLNIMEDAKIPSDSRLLINTLGLMGEKYVEIISDEATGDPLKPGDTIRGEAPFQMEKLMKKGEEIANNLDSVLTDVKTLSGKLNMIVDENRDSIRAIVTNVETSTKDVKEVIGTNKEAFGRIIQNTDRLADDLSDIVADNKEPIVKIIKNTESVTSNLDEILSNNKDEIERILANAETVSSNFVDFSDDIKQHPWKLLVKGKDN